MSYKIKNNNSPLVSCLIDLGLSEREARIYLALLNKRCATASELQKMSGVPQNKVYEIIGGLVRQGYCLERKVGRKRTFEIIDPKVALASPFQMLQKRLQDSYNLKKEMDALYAEGDNASMPLEYIEVLYGNDNIHHHYCQLVRNTDEELLGFGRGPYACDTTEKSEEQDQEEKGVLDRGGAVRWVYEVRLPEEEWIISDLKSLQEKGAGIRIAQSLPLKMMIFDRKTLLVAEEEPLAERGELVMSIIKQRTVVNAFRALFEFFWHNSIDLNQWENHNVRPIYSLLE